MRKQLRFLLLLWVFGCTLFFSCGIVLGGPPHPPPDTSLVADFGAQGGLCRYSYSTWSQLAFASANLVVEAPNIGLVANFPGQGLFRYLFGNNWTQLTPNDSVENLLGIVSWLFADFGSLGLWKYDGAWHNLSYSNPNMMLAYSGMLIANFPGQGLYELDLEGSMWTQLTPNDTVQALIVVKTPWGAPGFVYADYGTLGLWKYDGSTWAQITPADANLLGSHRGDLVANFPGHGLWRYDGTTWTLLTPNDTVQALVEVGEQLYADYGTLGLWKHDDPWVQISSADPNLLGSLPVVTSSVSTLVANFPGYGLYRYNGSWTLLTGNDGVTNMVGVDW